MGGIKKTIAAAVVALAVASVVHADMMPVSPQEGGYRWSLSLCDETTPLSASEGSELATLSSGIDLDLLPVGSLPAARVAAGGSGQSQPLEVLTDRQNSLSLCLYTLMGLGLCRTAPWIKRLYIGLIPDWYCTGGPYQIGHSFAISPDCLTAAPVICFLQPDSTAVTEGALPQLCRGIVVSLWRQSQFTPTTLASRGPPSRS